MNVNQMQTMQMNQMKISQSSTEAAAALNKNQQAFLSHYAAAPGAMPGTAMPGNPTPPQQSPPHQFPQQSPPDSATQEKKKKKKKLLAEDELLDDDDEEHKGGGGRWTKEEDRKLRAAVAAIGPKNWKRISQEFLDEQRSDVQCLHRWQKALPFLLPSFLPPPFLPVINRCL
jgi:hypothetical protein